MQNSKGYTKSLEFLEIGRYNSKFTRYKWFGTHAHYIHTYTNAKTDHITTVHLRAQCTNDSELNKLIHSGSTEDCKLVVRLPNADKLK